MPRAWRFRRLAHAAVFRTVVLLERRAVGAEMKGVLGQCVEQHVVQVGSMQDEVGRVFIADRVVNEGAGQQFA